MLTDIYKEFFTKKGIYIAFYEHSILNENLSIKTEQQFKRAESRINSIVSKIILLDKIEKGLISDETTTDNIHLLTNSIHTSLFVDFSILRNICDYFEIDAKTEFDYHAKLEDMMAKYNLTKEQANLIKIQWFYDIETIFAQFIAGKNSLRVFESENDIRFQFTNDDLDNILNFPMLSDDNGLIHSISFFSIELLYALQYIKAVVRCTNIELFSIKDYDNTILEAKKNLVYDSGGYYYNFANDGIYTILENFLETEV